VKVQDGAITLEGDVNWQFEKEAAADAVRYLTGVKRVNNDIDIKPSVSATEVKTKIENAFTRNALLDASGITVKVTDSSVTLQGSVRSWAERDEAERTAWNIPGVVRVDDRLAIR
jgi:osmotically-inducible protein OsmY